ncbi:MAG: hypothetical protein U9N86_06280 [Bacteroidota bacterium]|nr:hypothetical protein [Bacteroidota bacterium]
MLAPDFDNTIGNLPWSIDYINTGIYNSLISIYQAMTCIQKQATWYPEDRVALIKA